MRTFPKVLASAGFVFFMLSAFACKGGQSPKDPAETSNDQTPGGVPGQTVTVDSTLGSADSAGFYPASCQEIKAAKPALPSGVYKIYLDAKSDARIALDASCDMSEDGGGWTLILNYSHKANTNPALSIRTQDLPIFGADVLGQDESIQAKNWGHAGNALLARFAVKELRFYCRSSQNPKIVHFKSADAACIAAAQSGKGTCLNVKADFVKLSDHSAVLPGAADLAKNDEGNAVLTRDPFTQKANGSNLGWSVSGNSSNSWECDFGSNTFIDDTIHRVWFR